MIVWACFAMPATIGQAIMIALPIRCCASPSDALQPTAVILTRTTSVSCLADGWALAAHLPNYLAATTRNLHWILTWGAAMLLMLGCPGPSTGFAPKAGVGDRNPDNIQT